MRTFLGILVLVAGIGGLGYWGSQSQAVRMQESITAAANSYLGNTVHPVDVVVSGRDITVSGLADSEAERDRILQRLDTVEGRRVVQDDLAVLQAASPYVTETTLDEDGTRTVTGNVPRDLDRAMFDALDVAGGEALDLASGAPEGWADIMTRAVAALNPLQFGVARLEDTTLTITGTATFPAQLDLVNTALNGLPDGYNVNLEGIEFLDDGKPAAFDVMYDAASGARVDGKLPVGLQVSDLSDALGQEVAGDAREALTGDALDPSILDGLSALSEWLPLVEEGAISYADSQLSAEFALPKGTNVDLVQEAVAADLEAVLPGGSVQVALHAGAAQEGASRTNAATNLNEQFSSGYWLPEQTFDVSAESCAQVADEALASARINFVTGSATLGPRAVRTVNLLSSIVAHCVADNSQRAEIGGHTDAQGDDNANYALSKQRAQAVVDALVDRGIARRSLTAVGHGETDPIATNDTAEGRAQNRRTTVTWRPRAQ